MRVERNPAVAVGAITLVQVSALFIREVTRRTLLDEGMVPASAANVSALVGFAWSLLLLSGFLAKPDFLRLLRPGMPARAGNLFVAIAIGLMFRATDWLLLVFRDPALTPRLDGTALVAGCAGTAAFLADLLVMAVITPLFEESVYRGLICRIACRINIPVGILLSASLFAVFHPVDAWLSAFLFGVVIGLLFHKTGSLQGPALAHITFNGAAIVERHCLRLAGAETPAVPAALLLAILLLMIAACWLAASAAGAPGTPAPGDVNRRRRKRRAP